MGMRGAPIPFPESLCHGCRHLRLVAAARSTFLLCRIGTDERAKYPRQPVRACQLFEGALVENGSGGACSSS
jgi:hypothetical protein